MNKALIAGAVALALGLGACASEDPAVEEPSQVPVTLDPDRSDDPAVDETVAAGPTEVEPTEPAYDYEAIDMGTAPAEMTAPGAALGLGDVAWVEFEYIPGEADEEPGTASPEPETASPEASPTAEPLTSIAGIAVLDIVEGDETYWERFSNPEDFTGRIPFFVVHQETLDPAAFPENPARLDVWPQFADGTNAEFVAVFGISRSSDCGIELPDYDPATGIHMRCFIAIGEAGQPVTQVVYNGLDQFAIVYDETDIYVEAPLVWSAS